jgi:predicted tellurium resistance membrane protein TerC
VLGLTVEQLLILAGVGVALIVLLMILRAIFRLTRAFLRLGCLGVIIVLVIAFALMRGLAG